MREICGGRGELVFGVEGCLCVVAFEGGRGGETVQGGAILGGARLEVGGSMPLLMDARPRDRGGTVVDVGDDGCMGGTVE